MKMFGLGHFGFVFFLLGTLLLNSEAVYASSDDEEGFERRYVKYGNKYKNCYRKCWDERRGFTRSEAIAINCSTMCQTAIFAALWEKNLQQATTNSEDLGDLEENDSSNSNATSGDAFAPVGKLHF